LSLGLCLGGCGAVGLISAGITGIRMGRVKGYTPATEDWVWHVIIPFVAYAVLFASAFLLASTQEVALALVATVVLGLIFIGIHNAWDVALYIVTEGVPAVAAAEPPAASQPPPNAVASQETATTGATESPRPG